MSGFTAFTGRDFSKLETWQLHEVRMAYILNKSYHTLKTPSLVFITLREENACNRFPNSQLRTGEL